MAHVLLNHLLQHLEQGHLPESQCGFRAERGTVDMIFAARQLQEKCQEQHSDLFVTFVDLTKAFDTVSRDGLWKIMEKFGCPSKFITIVRQFHDGMLAVIKVKVTVIRDFLFADDCALNAGTEQKMQHELDCFSRACDNFGLTISTKKTEVMYQPGPGQPYQEPHIMVKGQELQAVDSFTYLGSTLSRAVNIGAEVINRIAKASSAFGRLRENVWERTGLSLTTKLKVYRAVVLTTLLYACETWTSTADMPNSSTTFT
ncbi:uncharacterized protein LOC125044886 [Penaeus chinensis]|uniref:uncharacterized protein LOC125044886 n=1 Tax=Penaeus chinensis TaxID=139456 RepID=UPI001FB8472B|nr:uncharacterized protein LOC125044886 [Penaeus chinensis]